MEGLTAMAVGLILFAVIVFLSILFHFVPIGLWITAYFSGVRVKIFKDLVGMRLRRSLRHTSFAP